LRNTVSAEEWQARVDLAMVYRVLAHFGFNDMTYMHVSLRLPDQPQRLLLKPRNMMFEEVTASSLEKFDFDGTPLQDGPRNVGGGLVIHAGILEARPEINAVFHTHTPANMGVSAQKHGLLMCNQHAVGFYQRMAYHSFGGFEFNMDQRAPLLTSLGDKTIALLRNHGALVCGTSLKKALIDHHYLCGWPNGSTPATRTEPRSIQVTCTSRTHQGHTKEATWHAYDTSHSRSKTSTRPPTSTRKRSGCNAHQKQKVQRPGVCI
jgi:ribulose-5-phosphate 4-epimerase/fuculose-1-phosphate aldolase